MAIARLVVAMHGKIARARSEGGITPIRKFSRTFNNEVAWRSRLSSYTEADIGGSGSVEYTAHRRCG